MYEDIKQSVVSHHSRVPIAQQRSKNTKVMGSVPGSVPTDKTCDLQVISDKAKCKQTKMIRSPWCTLNFSSLVCSDELSESGNCHACFEPIFTVVFQMSTALLWYSSCITLMVRVFVWFVFGSDRRFTAQWF